MKEEKKIGREDVEDVEETWDMQVLPRHDVAALHIDVFTKESGTHKEQAVFRNANTELTLLFRSVLENGR
jgi:hypothetical protein